LELKPIIAVKLGFNQSTLSDDKIELVERADAGHFRTNLQKIVKQRESVTSQPLVNQSRSHPDKVHNEANEKAREVPVI
jgi:hypothetical protein